MGKENEKNALKRVEGLKTASLWGFNSKNVKM